MAIANRSSPRITIRLPVRTILCLSCWRNSSRSDSVSSRPVSGWRSCWSATGNRSDGYEREPLRAPVEREEEREPDADAPFEDRERDEDERDREPDDREPDDREPDDREPAVERDRLDAVRRLRVVPPPFRSAAGISSRATAFVRVGIWPARNFAIRSSSRR